MKKRGGGDNKKVAGLNDELAESNDSYSWDTTETMFLPVLVLHQL